MSRMPHFYYKAQALAHLAALEVPKESTGQIDVPTIFGSDANEVGSKHFLVDTRRRVFKFIYADRQNGVPHDNRFMYENFESDSPIALALDLDVPCDGEDDLRLDDVFQFIDCVIAGLTSPRESLGKTPLISTALTLRNFVVTKSPFKADKKQQSYHVKLVGFCFDSVGAVKDLVFHLELHIVNTYFDDSIYSPGLLRLTGCSKKGKGRVLAPFSIRRGDESTLMPEDFQSFMEYWIQTCVTFVENYTRVVVPNFSPIIAAKQAHKRPESATTIAVYNDHHNKSHTDVSTLLLHDLLECLADKYATDYDLWVRVMFTLQNSVSFPAQGEAMRRLFDTLSKRATHQYNPTDTYNKWCKHASSDSEKRLTAGSLFKFAKESAIANGQMEVYQRIVRNLWVPLLLIKDLEPVFTMDVIQYDEPWCRPFLTDDYDTLVIQSCMGSGKTDRVIDVIKNMPADSRCLNFSTRLMFGTSMQERFRESGIHMTLHSDIHDTAVSAFKCLSISPESVHRIQANTYYDLVVVDECEAVFAQFESSTMQFPAECYKTFVMVIITARKVIFMDALISRKTMDMVDLLINMCSAWNNRKKCVVMKNTHRPPGRKAVYLRHRGSLKNGQEAFIDRIVQLILAGKRVACFSGSATFARNLVDVVLVARPETTHKLYTADMDDADKHVKNVNTEWLVQLLVYSPCILTGVDFSVRDHFHCVFGYLTASSVNCRDSLQAMHRVRYPVDNSVHFMIDGLCRAECMPTLPDVRNRIETCMKNVSKQYSAMADSHPLTIAEIRRIYQWTEDKANLMDAIESYSAAKSQVHFKTVPKVVAMNKALNELETDLHRRYFPAIFCSLIEKVGYTLVIEEMVALSAQVPAPEEPSDTEVGGLYYRTTSLSPEVFREYKTLVKRSRATLEIKTAVNKYEVDALVAPDGFDNEVKSQLFEGLWVGPKAATRRAMFNAVYTETHMDLDRLQKDELQRVQYLELLDGVVSSVKLVQEVCAILSFRNSVHLEVAFTTDDIAANLAPLAEKLEQISKFLKIRVRSKSDDKEKRVLSMLKAMFQAWCGMSVDVNKGVRTNTEWKSVYSLKCNDEFGELLAKLGDYSGTRM